MFGGEDEGVWGRSQGYVWDVEKALEYYERALKGYEKTLGKAYPSTLGTVMNIAIVYYQGLQDYDNAFEMFDKAGKGSEAQFGKDHAVTKRNAKNYSLALGIRGDT